MSSTFWSSDDPGSERAEVTGFIIRKERKTTRLVQAIEGDVTDAPIIRKRVGDPA